mgnify:FL=1
MGAMKPPQFNNSFVLISAAALIAVALTSPAAAQSVNAALVAANCAVCHGQGGGGAGDVPSLAKSSAAQIAENMRAIRDGKKPSTIMGRIAKGYTDAQIDAVANQLGKK